VADSTKSNGFGTVLVLAIIVGAVAFWVSNRGPSPPGNVLLVGDSLFFQSTPDLAKRIEDDGWTVDVRAGIGAGIRGGGVQPLNWARYLAPIVKAEKPEVVVIELGTNGCGPSCTGIRPAVDAVMNTVKDADLVIWLTVRVAKPPQSAAQINREIEAAPTRWPNLEIAPMDKWFVGHGNLLAPDHVHLNRAGQAFLAEHVRGVIRDHTG
jgi:lysophospholipase L1-like esterase